MSRFNANLIFYKSNESTVGKKSRSKSLKLLYCSASLLFHMSPVQMLSDQTIVIDGEAGGRRLDGIGAVNGGGATSV